MQLCDVVQTGVVDPAYRMDNKSTGAENLLDRNDEKRRGTLWYEEAVEPSMEEMSKGGGDCNDYANSKTVGQANDLRDDASHVATLSVAPSGHVYVIRVALTRC